MTVATRKQPPILFIIALLLFACTPESITTTSEAKLSSIKLESEPYFASQGGGEPRATGYWLVWNSCATDNHSETAAANGGRAAGWIIMDDMLQDPGIMMGELELLRCQDGLRLLAARPLQGKVSPDDLTYPLAAQLLAAQLNLAATAEYCPAVDDAVLSAQFLLIGAGFEGSGESLGLAAPAEDRELAEFLTNQLFDYNAGILCR